MSKFRQKPAADCTDFKDDSTPKTFPCRNRDFNAKSPWYKGAKKIYFCSPKTCFFAGKRRVVQIQFKKLGDFAALRLCVKDFDLLSVESKMTLLQKAISLQRRKEYAGNPQAKTKVLLSN
jgi:hypothetical protein